MHAGQKYDIVLEYYENTGEAVAKLLWSGHSAPKVIVLSAQLFPAKVTPPPPTVPTNGLQSMYYNGISLSGSPLITRIDTTINFEFTYSKQPLVLSPAPGVVPERYVLRTQDGTGATIAFRKLYLLYTER